MKPYLLAATLSLLPFTAMANQTASEIVEGFIAAYNTHDVKQMVQYTTDDVRWMHVTGTKVEVETSSQEEFAAAMADYFETLKDANATILKMIDSGHYVSTVERVTWDNDGEQLSQCSIGNFHIKNGKLAEFWYLPAHDCDDTEVEANVEEATPAKNVEPEIGVLQETQQ
ncbi:hypothetical protein Sps_03284 [Shewanella psychrophila]|uniref:SnoaL-like domain-containing protein n=1 Tax=Shewanella psychrophila TaxID=225848 RepID=A0A1S6HSB1_9GAMM|nr:nuclear transport factor 2 family protein [Shewanella psychrophila]AQS38420.1 hypothetical protein Sps_03284 [Shewanella psychrophila]